MVSLLQMSFSGAIFITAVVMIRAIAINRLPKKTFLVLWELILLRLLVPVSIPSVFSVYTLFGGRMPELAGAEGGIMRAVRLQNQISTIQTAEQLQAAVPPPMPLQVIVWCAGMTLLAIFFAIAYLRCLREFQTALPVHSHYVEKWLKERPLKRWISVRQSDRISTPLTYGIFHPVILLPKKTDWDSTKELQYVLTHEYVHIRRFDTATKLIMTAALCIHWFNPFVWVMYVLFNRDIELACDESVVRILGETSKSAYCLMLIDMEAKKSGVLPLCNNFSKNAIEERIGAIMKTKKTTIFSLVMACLLVGGTATAFATSAQAGGNSSSADEQDSTPYMAAGTAYEEGEMLSYVNMQDGKTYYSTDGGKSFEALTEEEFAMRFPTSDVEWWTYEEYKEWLENEKKELQSMIGEKGWTGGRGDFVWTQEIVDETIAMYEGILQDIKNGVKVSKSMSGDGAYFAEGNMDVYVQSAYNPQDVGAYEEANSIYILLSNGEGKMFGPYETGEELLSAVGPFCAEQVKLGNMEQSEADEILNRYIRK